MDEPGHVFDARPGEGPRRVQPDGARLQSPAGAQYRRLRRADGCGSGLKGACRRDFAASTGMITESMIPSRGFQQNWLCGSPGSRAAPLTVGLADITAPASFRTVCKNYEPKSDH